MEENTLSAKYSPSEIEEKWYQYWLDHQCFHSEVEAAKQPYTVVIPPPNVTGILHMGHMLNNTIQDVLVRRARMQGKNACWVPGLDHASIATEAKVVAWLKEQGIDKKKLSREEFLKYAWQWKEKYGGIILKQLRRLGASCDWDRTRFTMDPGCYEAVIDVFVRLYDEGLIYRGVRMVNWDPKALTALSDEEVIYKEVHGKLFYLRYEVVGQPGKYVIVATTRPETILGDVAVCVHPEDPRYTALHGVKLRVPVVNREIPVITDTYVDREFGTGCLKITPAHDVNDYEIGLKYKLEVIDIFEPDGRVNDKVGLYVGMDRFDLRKQIVKDIKAVGLLEKEEDYTNKVGYSERTDVVIEPKLSAQWFLKMPSLAEPALKVVMDDEVQFHPAKFKNTYRHWMETIKDWCISRQLWWGQRIPAYYLPNKEVVVARTAEDALAKAKGLYPEAAAYTLADLRQDEDVLDTWFSSWLWPMSVFDGVTKPDNPEINYYYPVCDLVTAPDIMFFWVARMIMAGLHFRKRIPFSHVYYTGTVRDKLGRKMSKSLGNSPDPIGLIDQYGADGVRVGMLLTSPAGNDLPFDEAMCEQGRNFCNKIWNALRLVKGWTVSDSPAGSGGAEAHAAHAAVRHTAVAWFEASLRQTAAFMEDCYTKYRLSDALMAGYKLIWDEFCAWYLEMIKPAYGQPIDRGTYEKTLDFFDRLMVLMHPFMPFLTEEVWHVLREGRDARSVMFETAVYNGLAQSPSETDDQALLKRGEFAKEVVMGIRAVRNGKNLSPKTPLKLSVQKNGGEAADPLFDPIVAKLCNLESLDYVTEPVEKAYTFVAGTTAFFVRMEAESVDVAAELAKAKEELAYAEGFLRKVMQKLGNPKFVDGAPEAVVAGERKKQADAEERIRLLKERIAQWEK